MEFIVGLDLGQAQDYSTLCIVERTERFPTGKIPDPDITPKIGHYGVRYLKRWPLGTPYPAIVKEVAALLDRPPLARCRLAVDATGVGRAVVDLFRQAKLPVSLVPITITAGHHAGRAGGGYHVAKKDLAGVLQVLLQEQRLKVAKLPEREVLLQELRTFRVKVSAAT